jgi:hypothetical protein
MFKLFVVFFLSLSLHIVAIRTEFPSYKLDEYRNLTFQKYVHFKNVYVEIGENIGKHVKKRILTHLSRVELTAVHYLETLDSIYSQGLLLNNAGSALLLSFGNASYSRHMNLEGYPPESYQIVFEQLGSNVSMMLVNGLPLDPVSARNASFNLNKIHYGAVAGSYAVLELLGFGFLHPLEPFIPPVLRFQLNGPQQNSITFFEKPFWPQRGFHIHTQHPLELTEVFQGHDIPQFGPHGPRCVQYSNLSSAFRRREYEILNDSTVLLKDHHYNSSSKGYCERWEDMLIDVDAFYEWSIANGLNMIEWLLLGNYKWGDELKTRFVRFKKLTALGHQYSLLIGCDVPIGNVQQHAWYMVNVRLPFDQQQRQIRERVDFLFHANYDFITTESGLSEFTHPECDLMLELFNTFASYIHEKWDRFSAVKVHCSTGQYCSQYFDPRSNEPVNFNFLPSFAHHNLGIFPHTVQVYSFDDPTSGTYGNKNFSYIEDYMIFESKRNERKVLYYGETAYWVNVDIDVPLFLPIYGQRRQKDLRKIAIREHYEGFHLSGQMNFDSGWEYGYWLNNLVTARSSWNPQVNEEMIHSFQNCQSATSLPDSMSQDGNTVSCSPYSDEWEIFSNSLKPFTSTLYGPVFSQRINALLVEIAKWQAHLLIHSYIHNRPNPNIKKLSGIAYLSGTDTWSELPRLFGLAFTQPDRVLMKESDDPDWPYVMELLAEMTAKFEELSVKFATLYHDLLTTFHSQQENQSFEINDNDGDLNEFLINEQAIAYLNELKDSLHLLSLRAKQVKLLYSSNDADIHTDDASHKRNLLLSESREVINQASDIILRREKFYRVPWQRIAAWRENPTVYRYGYLWAVHSLFYWWRDQGLAEGLNVNREHSPCYLNRMDSTEVAVGWGKYTLQWLRYFVQSYTPFSSVFPLEIVNCLSSPSREYEFPKDL